jgi:hypothetical protein
MSETLFKKELSDGLKSRKLLQEDRKKGKGI